MTFDNLDDIKDRWRDANAPLSELTDDTLRLSHRALLRRGSAQDRLASQYRRMIAISIAGIFIWLGAVMHIEFASWARPWLIAASMLFFGLIGCYDYYLYRGVRRIDLATWPVNDVVLEGRRLLRLHKIGVMIFILPAIGLVTFMVCALDMPGTEREGFLIGVLCGAVIGLIAGILTLLRFFRLYRTLTDGLGD